MQAIFVYGTRAVRVHTDTYTLDLNAHMRATSVEISEVTMECSNDAPCEWQYEGRECREGSQASPTKIYLRYSPHTITDPNYWVILSFVYISRLLSVHTFTDGIYFLLLEAILRTVLVSAVVIISVGKEI